MHLTAAFFIWLILAIASSLILFFHLTMPDFRARIKTFWGMIFITAIMAAQYALYLKMNKLPGTLGTFQDYSYAILLPVMAHILYFFMFKRDSENTKRARFKFAGR